MKERALLSEYSDGSGQSEAGIRLGHYTKGGVHGSKDERGRLLCRMVDAV